MRSDFRRIAIVNRAEPALRLIRAIREFNREPAVMPAATGPGYPAGAAARAPHEEAR